MGGHSISGWIFQKLFGTTTDKASMNWSKTAIPGDCDKTSPNVSLWTDGNGKQGERTQYQCVDSTYSIYTQNGEIKKRGYDNNNT